MLVPSAFLLISAGRELQLEITPAWTGVFVVDVLASMTIVLSFEFACGSLAFWLPRTAEELNSHTWNLLMTLSPFPLDGLPAWALGGLLTLVPAGLVAWYPSRALLGLGPPTWGNLVVLPGAAVVFIASAIAMFLAGLQHYGQTGSSRYLD